MEHDAPAHAEAPQQQSRVRLPQRRPRRPRDPGEGPPHSLTPVIRLGALVFIGIFIVLVFSLLIASCAGESKHDVYGNYMDKVATIATGSLFF